MGAKLRVGEGSPAGRASRLVPGSGANSTPVMQHFGAAPYFSPGQHIALPKLGTVVELLEEPCEGKGGACFHMV